MTQVSLEDSAALRIQKMYRDHKARKDYFSSKLLTKFKKKFEPLNSLFENGSKKLKSRHEARLKKISNLALKIKNTASLSLKAKCRNEQIKEIGKLFQKVKDETPEADRKNLSITDFVNDFNEVILDVDPDYNQDDLPNLTNPCDINALDNLTLIAEAQAEAEAFKELEKFEEETPPPQNTPPPPIQHLPPVGAGAGGKDIERKGKEDLNRSLSGTTQPFGTESQTPPVSVQRFHPQAPEGFTKQPVINDDKVITYADNSNLVFEHGSSSIEFSIAQAHINLDRNEDIIDLKTTKKASDTVLNSLFLVEADDKKLKILQTEDPTLTKESTLEGIEQESKEEKIIQALADKKLTLRDAINTDSKEQNDTIAGTAGLASPKPAFFTTDDKETFAVIANTNKSPTEHQKYEMDRYETYLVTMAGAKKITGNAIAVQITNTDFQEIALQMLAAIEAGVKIDIENLKAQFPGKEDAIDELTKKVLEKYKAEPDEINIEHLSKSLLPEVQKIEQHHFPKPELTKIPEELSLNKEYEEIEKAEDYDFAKTPQDAALENIHYFVHYDSNNVDCTQEIKNLNKFWDNLDRDIQIEDATRKEYIKGLRKNKKFLEEKNLKSTAEKYFEAYSIIIQNNVTASEAIQSLDSKYLLGPEPDEITGVNQDGFGLNLAGQALMAINAGYTEGSDTPFITTKINWKTPKPGDIVKINTLKKQPEVEVEVEDE